MASVAFTRSVSGVGDSDMVAWSLGAGDTGKPYMMANYADRTENPLWISPITTGGSGYVVTILGVK